MKVQVLVTIKFNKKYYNVGDKLDVGIGQAQKLIDRQLVKSIDVVGEKPEPGEKALDETTDSPVLKTEGEILEDLTIIKGIGDELAEALNRLGIVTIKGLANSNPKEIAAIAGIGMKTGEKIIKAAKKIKK